MPPGKMSSAIKLKLFSSIHLLLNVFHFEVCWLLASMHLIQKARKHRTIFRVAGVVCKNLFPTFGRHFLLRLANQYFPKVGIKFINFSRRHGSHKRLGLHEYSPGIQTYIHGKELYIQHR